MIYLNVLREVLAKHPSWFYQTTHVSVWELVHSVSVYNVKPLQYYSPHISNYIQSAKRRVPSAEFFTWICSFTMPSIYLWNIIVINGSKRANCPEVGYANDNRYMKARVSPNLFSTVLKISWQFHNDPLKTQWQFVCRMNLWRREVLFIFLTLWVHYLLMPS